MREYFDELKRKISEAYEIANRARSCGMDPDVNVESLPAGDLAARVEGLIGLEGIADRIRELGREDLPQIVDEILGDITLLPREKKERRIEQAVRIALAIITEGVVAAPIEGISRVRIESNPDGSEYLCIYFAGPIRSAGGTAQGITVVIADYIRRRIGLKEYRPTNDEIERYVEEIRIYNDRVSRLQYMPSDDDIRKIVKNVAICIDGDPTEKREVSIHRDLKRVETNRIRGGMCLVIAEGIAQKASKVMQYALKLGLDWNWLSTIRKREDPDEREVTGFMSEVVGGRPVFSGASAKGGFRLRYGRTRNSGIAAKSIHPATMILLDDFTATGTQLKVERPGKGCVVTACDSIEGPVVRLKDGSVLRVESVEQAKSLRGEIDEILFLGDLLISYGDFLQANAELLPAGYCEEWWIQEAKELGYRLNLKSSEAVEISMKYGIPLHPRYTYHWEDLSVKDLKKLRNWLSTGIHKDNRFLVKNDQNSKRTLELLGVPHTIENGYVVIEEYMPLLYPLGIYDGFNKNEFESKIKNLSDESNGLELIKLISPIRIRPKVGTYIGARMGRPEKAKERRMTPAVHSLFPVGFYGGKERSINMAAEKDLITVDVVRYECPKCKSVSIYPRCSTCGSNTVMRRVCANCKRVSDSEICPVCGIPTRFYERREINIKELWKRATQRVGTASVKGVQGMISEYKIPEPLEKGILRARYNISVFKDGTVRFDATNLPLTHFKPKEIMTSIERLKELGYKRDYLGNELKDENQIVELKVQDIVIPLSAGDYLLRTSQFIDELLEKFYGIPAYYKATQREDLIGEIIIGLAPHTSAGIAGRIIGFTRANVCYAHPFWHAAKRRNSDGDEDSIMLLLDTLINFSRKYLPEKIGGKMDAPLVISTILDPKEIDDEAHKMEIVDHYPLEFYEKTWKNSSSLDAGIMTVNSILETNPYSNIGFTHDVSDITGPVLESRYMRLTTMREKVDAQLSVAEKIRAIDAKVVAELLINSHFLRDTYGNLRAFSRQKFRCVRCNAHYRRIPLSGRCRRCGGRLLLTVTEKSIKKYLDISLELCERYNISGYLKQRLLLLQKDINSLFTNDLSKQVNISEYM